MDAGLGAAGQPANLVTISPGTERRRDRWFCTGLVLAAGLPPLSPSVHLHGILFTGWVPRRRVGRTIPIAAQRTGGALLRPPAGVPMLPGAIPCP